MTIKENYVAWRLNQLEMVTYKPSLARIDARNLVIVVTDPQTNKLTNTDTQTNRTDHSTRCVIIY